MDIAVYTKRQKNQGKVFTEIPKFLYTYIKPTNTITLTLPPYIKNDEYNITNDKINILWLQLLNSPTAISSTISQKQIWQLLEEWWYTQQAIIHQNALIYTLNESICIDNTTIISWDKLKKNYKKYINKKRILSPTIIIYILTFLRYDEVINISRVNIMFALSSLFVRNSKQYLQILSRGYGFCCKKDIVSKQYSYKKNIYLYRINKYLNRWYNTLRYYTFYNKNNDSIIVDKDNFFDIGRYFLPTIDSTIGYSDITTNDKDCKSFYQDENDSTIQRNFIWLSILTRKDSIVLQKIVQKALLRYPQYKRLWHDISFFNINTLDIHKSYCAICQYDIDTLEMLLVSDNNNNNNNNNTNNYYTQYIDRDIPRTRQHYNKIQYDKVLSSIILRNILIQYSIIDPYTGYCQGLNYISGFLLTQGNASTAFLVLYHLLNTLYIIDNYTNFSFNNTEYCQCKNKMYINNSKKKLYNYDILYKLYIDKELQINDCKCAVLPLRILFHQNLLGVHVTTKVLNNLLYIYIPKLAKHFDTIQFSTTFFVDWIMTFFTSIPNLPLSKIVQIWDYFIIEGTTSQYKLILAMLSIQQNILLQLDMETTYCILKKYPVIDMFSITELYPIIDTFNFNSCDIHKLQYSALIEQYISGNITISSFSDTIYRIPKDYKIYYNNKLNCTELLSSASISSYTYPNVLNNT